MFLNLFRKLNNMCELTVVDNWCRAKMNELEKGNS